MELARPNSKHSNRDRNCDVLTLYKEINKIRPFNIQLGRKIKCFEGIREASFLKMDNYAMRRRLQRILDSNRSGVQLDDLPDEEGDEEVE